MPQGFWKEDQNAKLFLEAVAKEMNFSSPRDLYTLSEKQFQNLKGGTLIANQGSLKALLTKFYPGT